MIQVNVAKTVNEMLEEQYTVDCRTLFGAWVVRIANLVIGRRAVIWR